MFQSDKKGDKREVLDIIQKKSELFYLLSKVSEINLRD
jgi:hypothetical protein